MFKFPYIIWITSIGIEVDLVGCRPITLFISVILTFGVAPFLGAKSNEEFNAANMEFINLVADDFSDIEGAELRKVDVGNKYDDQFVHDDLSLNKGIAIGCVSHQMFTSITIFQ